MGLSPEEAGELFSSLDNETANAVAYMFSGVGDGDSVRLAGKGLKRE